MTRRLAQELPSELIRILPGSRRQLVDERLDGKSLERRTDRSPESIRDAGVGFRVFHPNVRDVVRQSRGPSDGYRITPVGTELAESFHQRLLHQALHEHRRLA